jgi:hypothetical protein
MGFMFQILSNNTDRSPGGGLHTNQIRRRMLMVAAMNGVVPRADQ